jgi:hypothetical protein
VNAYLKELVPLLAAYEHPTALTSFISQKSNAVQYVVRTAHAPKKLRHVELADDFS